MWILMMLLFLPMNGSLELNTKLTFNYQSLLLEKTNFNLCGSVFLSIMPSGLN